MAAAEEIRAAREKDLFAAPRAEGPWRSALRQLARNRLAAASALLLAAIVIISAMTAAVPWIERYPPEEQHVEDRLASPSKDHVFGTDRLGRDLWSRAWEGIRISVRIGIGTQLVALVIGLAVGACAALGGRFVDNALMRLVDVAYAFPDLLAIILMRSVLSGRDWPIIGTGDPQVPGLPGEILQVILAISLVTWVTIARLVRGQMLALREEDYVTAARAVGASTPRIVFAHMLPNTLGPVIVAVTFGIPLAINAEAALALIGFGLAPPSASLGTLIIDGYESYRANMWGILVPAGALGLLTLCFTFVGDGLRDALDPRSRR